MKHSTVMVYLPPHSQSGSQDSTISIVTRLWARQCRVWFPATAETEARDFSLLQSSQFYTPWGLCNGYWGSFLRGTLTTTWRWPWTPPCEDEWKYTSTPNVSSWDGQRHFYLLHFQSSTMWFLSLSINEESWRTATVLSLHVWNTGSKLCCTRHHMVASRNVSHKRINTGTSVHLKKGRTIETAFNVFRVLLEVEHVVMF